MGQPQINNLMANMSLLLETFGVLLMVPYILKALLRLLQCKSLSNHSEITEARLLVAQGAITGLNYKLAATLLDIAFHLTWSQVARVVVIFVLTTVLSHFFKWEQSHLSA